jgi:hypothetical protein
VFETNSRDSTGYKTWRKDRPVPPVNDQLQLWVGQRVRLVPVDDSDEAGEEFGVVEEYQSESRSGGAGGMFTVTVEDRYLDDPDDDGLRELGVDQVELVQLKAIAAKVEA